MYTEDDIQKKLEHDRNVWNNCATVFEERIVSGHPNIVANEMFEEDLLDRVLIQLALTSKRNIQIIDVGCGSGRIHLRYGLMTTDATRLPPTKAAKIKSIRIKNSSFTFDSYLAAKLHSIRGIDISSEMLKLAKKKLRASGIGEMIGEKFTFELGSVFELESKPNTSLPVAVCLNNSIGIMQGPLGAIQLFKVMREMVESCHGVAVISAYYKEAISSQALNRYESTMDVSGQPKWLVPNTYATPRYKQIPRNYKRAYDYDPNITVDVFSTDGEIIKEGHILRRDEKTVDKVVETGNIQTYDGYQSNWYSYDLFDQWIRTHWPVESSYHLRGEAIDALRAQPIQLAILDCSGKLEPLLKRWNSGS